MQSDQNNRPKLRGLPMLVMLACGIIVMLIGVYLTFSGQRAYGDMQGSKYRRGGPVDLSGIGVIVVGLLVCSFSGLCFLQKRC